MSQTLQGQWQLISYKSTFGPEEYASHNNKIGFNSLDSQKFLCCFEDILGVLKIENNSMIKFQLLPHFLKIGRNKEIVFLINNLEFINKYQTTNNCLILSNESKRLQLFYLRIENQNTGNCPGNPELINQITK